MLKPLNAPGTVSPAACGVMLAVTVLPLVNGGIDHPVMYWILLPLLGAALIQTLKDKANIVLDPVQPGWWFFLFALWSGTSIFWSLNPHRTLVEFLQLAIYGLVFILASRLTEDNIVRVGRVALIAGTGIALLGISQYLFLSSGRIQGTFTNANPLGIYLAMLFCCAWGFFLRRPGRPLFITALVLAIGLVLSGSRGSIIALMLALPLMFFGFSRQQLSRKVAATVLMLVLALVVSQGLMKVAPRLQGNPTAQQLLIQTLVRSNSLIPSEANSHLPSSVVGRLAFWEVGERLALSEPLKGYGLGTYYLAYFLEYQEGKWYSRFAHNHYLQTAVETGFTGLLLLAAFILTAASTVRKRWRHGPVPPYLPGVLAGSAAFLLHMAIDFSWNFPGAAVVFFGLFGAATGYGTHRCSRCITLNYKPAVLGITVLFCLSLWQFVAESLFLRGGKLAARGNIRDSIWVYETAATLYPLNPMVYSYTSHNYTQLYLLEQDPRLLNKSLLLARRAVELSPVDGNLNNKLGRLYWQLGDMKKAEQHLVLGAEYGAYLPGRYLDLARFYLYRDLPVRAKAVCLRGLDFKEAVLKSAPGDIKPAVRRELSEMHRILSSLYCTQGDTEAARYHFLAHRELLR